MWSNFQILILPLRFTTSHWQLGCRNFGKSALRLIFLAAITTIVGGSKLSNSCDIHCCGHSVHVTCFFSLLECRYWWIRRSTSCSNFRAKTSHGRGFIHIGAAYALCPRACLYPWVWSWAVGWRTQPIFFLWRGQCRGTFRQWLGMGCRVWITYSVPRYVCGCVTVALHSRIILMSYRDL